MNNRIKRIFKAALAVVGIATAGQVHASMVAYENVGFIKGTDSFTGSFTIDTPGTYQAKLTDFVFPVTFNELSLDVTTADTSQGMLTAAGSLVFDAETPGTYYANIFGKASGPLDLGLFGVKIESFTAPPVPIPAAIILLASGLCVLGQMAWRRRGSSGRDNFVTKQSYSSVMV